MPFSRHHAIPCSLDHAVQNVGVVHNRSPSTGDASVVMDLYGYLLIVGYCFQKFNMDKMYKIGE